MKFIINYFTPYKNIDKFAWLVIFCSLLNRAGSMVVVFFTLYLQSTLNYSLSDIAKVMTFFGFSTIIGNLLGGALTDLFDTKKLLVSSYFLSAFVIFFLPQLRSLVAITICLVIYGLLIAMLKPANNILIHGSRSLERLQITSLYRVSQNLGMSIAGGLGGIILSFNPILIFVVNSGFSLLSGVLLLLIQPQHIEKKSSHSSHSCMSIFNLFKIAKSKDFMLLSLLSLISLTIFNQIFTVYGIYLHDSYQLSYRQIGILYSMNAIVILLLEIPLLNYYRNSNLYRLAGFGIMLIGIGFIVLTLGRSYALAMISCIICSIGEIFFFPIMQTIALDDINKEELGKHVGGYYMFLSLGSMISPIIGLNIFSAFGGNILWITNFMVSILVAAFLLKRSKLSV